MNKVLVKNSTKACILDFSKLMWVGTEDFGLELKGIQCTIPGQDSSV